MTIARCRQCGSFDVILRKLNCYINSGRYGEHFWFVTCNQCNGDAYKVDVLHNILGSRDLKPRHFCRTTEEVIGW